jgi:hypothetical protein
VTWLIDPTGPNAQQGTCQSCGRIVPAREGTVYTVDQGSGPGRDVLLHSRRADCEDRPRSRRGGGAVGAGGRVVNEVGEADADAGGNE